MKKLAAIFMILALALCMCACGDISPIEVESSVPADPAKLHEDLESAIAYIEANVDTSGAERYIDDSDESYQTCYWDFGEDRPEKDFSNEVEIDGISIKVGETKVKDLETLGFDVEKPGDTVDPQASFGVTLHRDGKQAILSLMRNPSDQPAPIAEFPVYGFSGGIAEFTIPYSYEGLTYGTPMEDVIEKLGNPYADLRVSSDSVAGTIIEISYDRMVPQGETMMCYSLDFRFLYDAEANSTTMEGMNLTYYSMSGE